MCRENGYQQQPSHQFKGKSLFFFYKIFYQVFKDRTFYKRFFFFFREFQSMMSASDDCYLSSDQDTQLVFSVSEDQSPYLLFGDMKILQ